MYRKYLLKNGFWAKKGNEQFPGGEKVFLKHDIGVGGIYATIQPNKKGVKIIVNQKMYFFNNFDNLDAFLTQLHQSQTKFNRILKRKLIRKELNCLKI